ncbi:hypothetical protein BJ085DRAFT_19040 [Dimargaris cristalligena]|uniref:Kinase n=1 Tax=Dimargaris cristalligena TaxID=215637 RepID=A0A4Q0A278_9FUNG|nr:hypothetical protein BJ085DRAFT_19040 [Dimargaris cristalligena]|eukprot:RKP39928.1 hypothetical protein BJ085DRAFT_19040 [Dimargaris cristalligena]
MTEFATRNVPADSGPQPDPGSPQDPSEADQEESGVMFAEGGELLIKPCHSNERDFYEQTVDHPNFQLFLPHYFGMLNLSGEQTASLLMPPTQTDADLVGAVPPRAPEDDSLRPIHSVPLQSAVCIENLLHGFSKPCVIDVKMALPSPTIEANPTEPPCINIRVASIKTHDESGQNRVEYEPDQQIISTTDSIAEEFRKFLPDHLNHEYREFLIKEYNLVLKELSQLIATEEVRLPHSSLLFIYEGDTERQQRILAEESESDVMADDEFMSGSEFDDEEDDDDDTMEDANDKMLYDLRLLDFTHSTWTPGQGQDADFLQSLDSLRDVLRLIL